MINSTLSLSEIGPIRKDSPIGPGERIRTVRDAQPLTQEEIVDNRIELFPPNPVRNNVYRNYEQNPFPRNLPVRMLAMGFGINKPYIETVANVDVELFMNELKRAAVEVRRQEGDKRVIRLHMSQFFDWHTAKLQYASFDDGTDSGATYAVNMGTTVLYRLPDPDKISLKPDERYEVTIVFNDETDIPAEADLEVFLYGFIQVAHPPYRS